MAETKVVVIDSYNEVLIFQYDEKENSAIGAREFFDGTGRNIEDYDMSVHNLPVAVMNRLLYDADPDRYIEDIRLV